MLPDAKRPEWLLIVREGSGAERFVALGEAQTPLIIGRDADCAVCIESPYVSRLHARVEWQDGAATLTDLGSRNGSLLNGARVEGEAGLRDGDVITIGDAAIRCRIRGPSTEPTRTLLFDGPGSASPSLPPPVTADTLRVDAETHGVFIGDQLLPRPLSPQEFHLVSYLFDRSPRICTRDELGDAIWGRDKWDPNMLHRLVHRLKEKLEPSPQKPRYLQTVPWVGYRLTP